VPLTKRRPRPRRRLHPPPPPTRAGTRRLVHALVRQRRRLARVARVGSLGVQSNDSLWVARVRRTRPHLVCRVRRAHQKRRRGRGSRQEVFALLWRRHSGGNVHGQWFARLVQAGHQRRHRRRRHLVASDAGVARKRSGARQRSLTRHTNNAGCGRPERKASVRRGVGRGTGGARRRCGGYRRPVRCSCRPRRGGLLPGQGGARRRGGGRWPGRRSRWYGGGLLASRGGARRRCSGRCPRRCCGRLRGTLLPSRGHTDRLGSDERRQRRLGESGRGSRRFLWVEGGATGVAVVEENTADDGDGSGRERLQRGFRGARTRARKGCALAAA